MAHLEEKLRNYVHHVDTSFAKEEISTTVEYYPGTEVTYTPVPGADKVVYECSYQISWLPDEEGSYFCTRLQHSTDNGSSWTDVSGAQMLEGNYNSQTDYCWYNLMYVFMLDAWSGSRKLRLAGRAYSTAVEYTVGRSYIPAPSSGEGAGSCPHVTIYSVMP